MSIYVRGAELTDTANLVVGGRAVTEVYASGVKVWPTTVVDVEANIYAAVHNTGLPVTLEVSDDFKIRMLDGTSRDFTAGTHTIYIKLVYGSRLFNLIVPVTTSASFIKFKSDTLIYVSIYKLGLITTLRELCNNLHNLHSFLCGANTSRITDFAVAWSNCEHLASFPTMDFSGGTDFTGTWAACSRLKCLSGKVDFSSLVHGNSTFVGCSALLSPPTIGTQIRRGDNATAGIWTNHRPCPDTSLPGADISVIPLPTATSFTIETSDDFTTEQKGITTNHTAGTVTVAILAGNTTVNINIPTTTARSFFKFKDDKLLSVEVQALDNITTLNSSFMNLSSMTSFTCTAPTTNITNLDYAWFGCTGLTSFPAIDTGSVTSFFTAWAGCSNITNFPELNYSSGVNLSEAWDGCTKLTCLAGTVDFSSLTGGSSTFASCTALIAPASAGTPIRNIGDATTGRWTNPNACP